MAAESAEWAGYVAATNATMPASAIAAVRVARAGIAAKRSVPEALLCRSCDLWLARFKHPRTFGNIDGTTTQQEEAGSQVSQTWHNTKSANGDGEKNKDPFLLPALSKNAKCHFVRAHFEGKSHDRMVHIICDGGVSFFPLLWADGSTKDAAEGKQGFIPTKVDGTEVNVAIRAVYSLPFGAYAPNVVSSVDLSKPCAVYLAALANVATFASSTVCASYQDTTALRYHSKAFKEPLTQNTYCSCGLLTFVYHFRSSAQTVDFNSTRTDKAKEALFRSATQDFGAYACNFILDQHNADHPMGAALVAHSMYTMLAEDLRCNTKNFLGATTKRADGEKGTTVGTSIAEMVKEDWKEHPWKRRDIGNVSAVAGVYPDNLFYIIGEHAMDTALWGGSSAASFLGTMAHAAFDTAPVLFGRTQPSKVNVAIQTTRPLAAIAIAVGAIIYTYAREECGMADGGGGGGICTLDYMVKRTQSAKLQAVILRPDHVCNCAVPGGPPLKTSMELKTKWSANASYGVPAEKAQAFVQAVASGSEKCILIEAKIPYEPNPVHVMVRHHTLILEADQHTGITKEQALKDMLSDVSKSSPFTIEDARADDVDKNNTSMQGNVFGTSLHKLMQHDTALDNTVKMQAIALLGGDSTRDRCADFLYRHGSGPLAFPVSVAMTARRDFVSIAPATVEDVTRFDLKAAAFVARQIELAFDNVPSI